MASDFYSPVPELLKSCPHKWACSHVPAPLPGETGSGEAEGVNLSIPYCLTWSPNCAFLIYLSFLPSKSLATFVKSPHLFHCVHLRFSWPHFVLQGHWLGAIMLHGDTYSASENPLTTLKPISKKVEQRRPMGKWLPGICQVLSPSPERLSPVPQTLLPALIVQICNSTLDNGGKEITNSIWII